MMELPTADTAHLTSHAKRLAREAERFRQFRDTVANVRATASTANGAVEVTVDSTGVVVDVVTTDRIGELPPREIGARVLAAIRAAQSQLAERVGQVADGVLGSDKPTGDALRGELRAKFPAPAPEPLGTHGRWSAPSARPQPPAPLPAHPTPQPPARSRAEIDDDSWADEPIMRPIHGQGR